MDSHYIIVIPDGGNDSWSGGIPGGDNGWGGSSGGSDSLPGGSDSSDGNGFLGGIGDNIFIW